MRAGLDQLKHIVMLMMENLGEKSKVILIRDVPPSESRRFDTGARFRGSGRKKNEQQRNES
jgi:hypothetical protein